MATPGSTLRPRLQRASITAGSAFGATISSSACAGRRLDRAGHQHGARADERGLADLAGDDLDASNGSGEFSGTSIAAETGLDQGGGDRFRLVRLHTAENGDQGRRSESDHHSSPA